MCRRRFSNIFPKTERASTIITCTVRQSEISEHRFCRYVFTGSPSQRLSTPLIGEPNDSRTAVVATQEVFTNMSNFL